MGLILLTYTIGHYNASVRITSKLLTPLMLCVLIVYINGETYSLKSTPNDRFSEKLFMAILFTIRVFARNLKYFLYFILMSALRLEPWLYV